MTTSAPLQQFARQLAAWAEQIIENGRTPFRRVDLFQQLQTAEGPCHPPLIFWINRQSLIAGGLIFLPENGRDRHFKLEAAAAAALGLRHFVTWESDQINLWERSSPQNRLVTSLPLSNADTPATFHHRLYELTDQMKLYAVTGRVENHNLSPYYLLNLLLETLALATPALLEECRLQRSNLSGIRSAEENAEDWGRLTMMRLLYLIEEHSLPGDLSPEQLPQALGDNLALLDNCLGSRMNALSPPPATPLPPGCTISFHHLLLRLQQLGWQENGTRREEVLRLLLRHWYVATQPNEDPGAAKRLLLHSRELAPTCLTEVSDSGAQLAANMLWRHFERQRQPQQIQGDAFHFNAPLEFALVHANFFGGHRPETAVRRELAGHLRSSWPNRGLSVPGNLPYWVSEALHLLGLTPQGGAIELHLPANWLKLLYGTFFCDLLFENFTIIAVDWQPDERQVLRLRRGRSEMPSDCRLRDGSLRRLELGENGPAAAELLYAMHLPADLYELVSSQQLVPLMDPATIDRHAETLLCYARSAIGVFCWQLLSASAPPASVESLVQNLGNGWLVPDDLHLEELGHQLMEQTNSLSDAQVDALLSALLNLQDDLLTPGRTPKGLKQEQDNSSIRRNLGEELLRQLEIEGIPHFPQTYLYRQETGPLRSFQFVPPLRLLHEMLGQYELEDAAGQRLQLTGEETMDALLLAGNLGLTSLEIPQDRQMTAEMLDQYRQDLKQLQTHIAELCHRHIEQPSAAQRLQKKLWNQLQLPPVKWLSD